MSSILNKSIVLVPNRNWQAIHVRTPQEAFCRMATNVATGLEIEGENQIRPNSWDNCVWASRRVNAHKGNRLPDEAGLRLLKLPRAPRELPVSAWIENHHQIRDCRIFLG